MQMLSLDCPKCGAHLPPKDPRGQVSCEYCGASFQAAQARGARTLAGQAIDPRQLAQMIADELRRQPNPQPVRPAPPPSIYGPSPEGPHLATARRGCAGVSAVFVVIVTLVPVGLGLFFSGVLAEIPGLSGVPGLGQVVESTEHLLYDRAGGLPQPVEIGGKPALLCRTRKVMAGDELFVDAYDARSVNRLWRIGPLGTYTNAYQAVHFGASGSRLVVSDAEPSLHIHDLETGAELKSLALTDRVASVCAAPPEQGKSLVWIEQVDARTHLVDLEAMTMSEAPRPEWCPDQGRARMWHEWTPGVDNVIATEEAPQVEGLRPEVAFVEGDAGVVFGVKETGTAFPMMAGFDPGTKAVRYKQEIAAIDPGQVRPGSAEHAALHGGRFFTVYGSGSDFWHATAFDAESGARLWHTDLRPIFAVDSINGIKATADHVFVVRTSSLEVFSADAGELLGTIGKETYD